MPFSLLPRLMTRELPDLTPEMLCQRGIRLLMLDFDNTIVPYTTDVPTEKMEFWLERMKNFLYSRIFGEKKGPLCVTKRTSS